MHSGVYEWIWFKLGLMIDTNVLYILILALLTLTLVQGHMSVRKQKFMCQFSHKVFNRFQWNLVYCCVHVSIEIDWKLIGVMNLTLLLCHPYSREKTLLYDFVKNNFNVGLYSDIYRSIAFKLGMMRETAMLYVLISVWMTLTFVQGHSSSKKFEVHVLANLSIYLDKFQYAAITCSFVKAHGKFILHK